LHVPRRLDNDGKARFDNNNWRVCVRTFVFRGGPELGQLGSVRPIKVRLQMKGWAVRPWLCRSSGRGAPKNEDIVFGGVGAREGVSNGYFGRIWIDCSKTSKSDVDGRVDDGCEDKIYGEQN
jgi:hypothetical protein